MINCTSRRSQMNWFDPIHSCSFPSVLSLGREPFIYLKSTLYLSSRVPDLNRRDSPVTDKEEWTAFKFHEGVLCHRPPWKPFRVSTTMSSSSSSPWLTGNYEVNFRAGPLGGAFSQPQSSGPKEQWEDVIVFFFRHFLDFWIPTPTENSFPSDRMKARFCAMLASPGGKKMTKEIREGDKEIIDQRRGKEALEFVTKFQFNFRIIVRSSWSKSISSFSPEPLMMSWETCTSQPRFVEWNPRVWCNFVDATSGASCLWNSRTHQHDLLLFLVLQLIV